MKHRALTVTFAAAMALGLNNAIAEQNMIERVGGDTEISASKTSAGWQSGVCRITTPLPEGYPAPTPPGALEIKHYPTVRRAEVTGDSNMYVGSNMAFWKLFNHIKRRDIAMTSPVETDMHGWSGDGDKPDSWTMSFLYRVPGNGETGDDRSVRIVDTEPVTVLAVGVQGSYGSLRSAQHLKTLNDWLTANPQWRQAGDPRSLAYNGPDVSSRKRWGELQLPIELVPVVSEDQNAPDESAGESAEELTDGSA